jgi:hypothetical protein
MRNGKEPWAPLRLYINTCNSISRADWEKLKPLVDAAFDELVAEGAET